MFYFQDFIFEEIHPTKIYVPQSRTMIAAYEVVTHTSRVIKTEADDAQSVIDSGNLVLNIKDMFPLITPAVPPSTTFTTITVTKVSTVTTEVTSDIIVTLGGRPVQTEYIRPTTLVSILKTK